MLIDCLVICRFVHIMTVMLLAGGSVLLPVLAGQSMPASEWRRLRGWLGAIVAVTAVAWLLLVAGLLSGDAALMLDPATIGVVLGQTGFGHVWGARLIMACVLLAILWLVPKAQGLATGLAIGLLASLAFTGHAVRDEAWRGVAHEINQMVHLLAGGLWLGGLALLSWMLLARRVADPEMAQALQRFSAIGYGMVAAIVATGAVNAVLMLERPGDLATSAYGRGLLLKIVMVAAMILLAGNNRFLLAPFLLSNPTRIRHRLVWSVGTETALGIAVLAVTAWLGMQSPPDG